MAVMVFREFYSTVVPNEIVCHRFLVEKGLLKSAEDNAPCHKCGTEMQVKRRKCRNGEWTAIFRCPKRSCQTTRSPRAGSSFFHFTDLNQRCNSGLSLCKIVELVFMFILELPTKMVMDRTGRSNECVTDWFNLCREVCTAVLKTKGKMVGNARNPIQIDETCFAGRKKHKDRIFAGDTPPSLEDIDADVINNLNHGAQVDCPWVFGLKNGNDCRYFYIQRRDPEILLPIIERECEAGSEIHSNEWDAYRCLTSRGFVHKTINHQTLYNVDSNVGAHTQSIKRAWLDAKIKLLKKMRGVPLNHLQSHLDHYCWRLYRKDSPDLFLAFLEDIQKTNQK